MTASAREIVEEIAKAKSAFFDAYLEGHIEGIDADISGLIVPQADWHAGYFSEPVRFSVATRKDSIIDGRFMATVEFDLTRRNPGVTVNAVVMLADGTCRSCNVGGRPKEFSSWEIAVMEARWMVQFAIAAAKERLGIPACVTHRPERPQRELAFFATIPGRKAG